MAGRPLTPKQQRFAEEYPKDLNATQAWIRAGGSPKSADVNGPRMLGNAGVKAAIDEALAARSKRTLITVDQVLSELAQVALADIGQAFDEEGNLLPLHEMPEGIRRAISAITVEERWENVADDASGFTRRGHVANLKRINFWDKPRTLELLGKHLKMFKDIVQHQGAVSIAVIDPYSKVSDEDEGEDG